MRILVVNAVEWGPDHKDKVYPKDVGQWIVDAFGGEARRFEKWEAVSQPEPPPGPVDAVVISGSPASAYEDLPWIHRLAENIRRWAGEGTPTLGICFGHQMLAQALGGRVEKNAKGWEVGVAQVGLSDAGKRDALFGELPGEISVMESHQDHVVEPPPGAEVLACNSMSPCQAMKIGDHIRSVQFHPEYTPGHFRFLLEPRREKLTRAGVDMDAALASIRETPQSRAVLQNFERHFIRAKESSACSTK